MSEFKRNTVLSQTHSKITATDVRQDYSFHTKASPSMYAVHPQDNTSEREPDQPMQADRLFDD